MKRILFLTISLLTAVSCYDDSALRETLKEHEERISALETLCAQLNTNMASLQTIVEALDANDYVTGVAPIMEGNKTIGYTLTFKRRGSVTIYNGNSPELKIENDVWYISYDDGKTWEKVGDVTSGAGDTFIVDIDVDGEYMTLTLSDGQTVIKVPLANLPPVMTVVPNYRSVRFYGKVFPTAVDYKVGVIVNDEEQGVMEAIAEGYSDGIVYDFAEDGSFEISVSCHPNSQNFYRVYAYANGTYSWSDLMTFESNNAEMQYDVSGRTINSVQLNGKVNLKFPDEDAVVKVEYGYSCYYNDRLGRVFIHDALKEEMMLAVDGSFSITIDNLEPDTQYFCQVVVRYDEKEYIDEDLMLIDEQGGPCIEFTTLSQYEIPQDLDVASAADLSSSASANCYIVSESGLYKFRAVKGNDASQTLSGAASAEILWETFGTSTVPELYELISGACYKDGYIAFQTADTFKEGNAVIAAKDASGKILWSWHIWFTDEPQGQEYYNNAGTMMDRNLGATSATPGDVGALGLLYQWGRKDPFLGSSSISEVVEAKSTITWPSAVSTSTSCGTVSFVTAHPTTFVKAPNSPCDWHYSSRDNNLWTTSDKSKSIYDPCPVGWRVPDGGENGIWSKALGSLSSFDYTYDSTNEGMNFSGTFGSAQSIWYPASGYRFDLDGSLYAVGYDGYCRSASPGSFLAFDLRFSNNGYVDPSGGSRRAGGQAVRCVRE